MQSIPWRVQPHQHTVDALPCTQLYRRRLDRAAARSVIASASSASEGPSATPSMPPPPPPSLPPPPPPLSPVAAQPFNTPVSPLLEGPGTLGFGFSAGGLLYAYYVGVLIALRDELGLLNADTPVAGASAGAIVAVTAKSGLSESDLIQATLQLASDCRQNGTRFRLRSVLERTLHDVLPDDIHERCSGSAYLAVTQLWPDWKPLLVSEHQSRQQLIDSVLTSCHIPWYFDGSLMRGYGNPPTLAFDGGLSNFIPVPPNCTLAVRVACFPSRDLRWFKGIGISPDAFESWPHDMRQMVQWALEPASEEFLLYLVDKGKRDARAWAAAQGLEKPKAPPAVPEATLVLP